MGARPQLDAAPVHRQDAVPLDTLAASMEERRAAATAAATHDRSVAAAVAEGKGPARP